MTGLKPNHFYNVRVIAIGANNFRAGSPVIRLRTFCKDGKPQLGNSRLPTSFAQQEPPNVGPENEIDDSASAKTSVPSVEAAPVLDGNVAASREPSLVPPGQRRNTLNRRHSPSVVGMDQLQLKPTPSVGPELSLDELNQKFESIRKEIDDAISLYAKDEAEFLQQEDELKKEKERKRSSLKEREEQTMQLKSSLRSSMEQMRAAEKERAKKEHQLKDRQNKKSKIKDSILKLENDTERMKKERASFDTQRADVEERRDIDVKEIDEENAELQRKCAELEVRLKDLGKQLQDMREAREKLPGGDDDQWKEEDAKEKRDWDLKRNEMHNLLVSETKKAMQLDQHIQILNEQLAIQQQSGLGSFFNQAERATVETELTQPKRLSHGSAVRANSSSGPGSNTNNLSPSNNVTSSEPGFTASAGFSHQGFAPGLFMNMDRSHAPQSEAELKSQGGPLSPSASSLLPSGIFDDPDLGNIGLRPRDVGPFLPEAISASDEYPQSPASSSRSFTGISSPHDSTYNLPFPQYGDGTDQRSINLGSSSPVAPAPATGHRFTSLLSSFQRSRAAKAAQEEGPAVGSLKSSQSQSFPRRTDEVDMSGNKRRISLSFIGRNSAVGENNPGAPSGSRVWPTRRINAWANSATSMFSSQNRDDSRPASIASTELPRPSTDSSSIWATPGDNMGLAKNPLWSPGDSMWASRSGSRRQSLHGSFSALETTLASADDEILDDTAIKDPQSQPSQVGVIGSRPPRSRAASGQNLNPNAPTFMGFSWRKDKDRERSSEKSRDGKGKGITPTVDEPSRLDESPSDSRMSRDTFSVHTQTSVSESHESLALDASTSRTPSDANPSSVSTNRDAENAVRKLFRKGSSSKFSLSSRLGKDSSLFKKGGGGVAIPDKNAACDGNARTSIGDVDDLGEDVTHLGRSYDSITSSPSLGPAKSKDSRDSRMSAWRFSMKKKGRETAGKEKESLEMDRGLDEDEVGKS